MFLGSMMPRSIANKGYAAVADKRAKIHFQPYITADWLDRFITLCAPIKQLTRADFDKHIGAQSSYRSKAELISALQFHYAILSGQLDTDYPELKLSADQKATILSKLTEEIAACTPGYHSRVNSVLESYFLPKTMAELFSNLRTAIIERVAAENQHGEVHNNNRYFIVAASLGYGIKPKLDNDPYRGFEGEQVIADKIRRAFAQDFQPFSTLRGIREMIISRFELYNGRNENEGYNLATYGPGLDYLKTLFKEEQLNYDYLIQEERGVQDIVVDINWDLILQRLWLILITERYFDFSTWDESLHWIPGFEKLVNYLWRTKPPYKKAIEQVGQLFLQPQTDLSEAASQDLVCLFSSEVECFAYLNCNPNLALASKVAIFFASLKQYTDNKNNPQILDKFWGFLVDNPDMLERCGAQLKRDYSEHFQQRVNVILQGGLLQQFQNRKNLRTIQRMLLQLAHVDNEQLTSILLLEDSSGRDIFSYLLTPALLFPDALNQQVLSLLKKLPQEVIQFVLQRHLKTAIHVAPQAKSATEYFALLELLDSDKVFEILYSPSCGSLLLASFASKKLDKALYERFIGLLDRLSDQQVTCLLSSGDEHAITALLSNSKGTDFLMPFIAYLQQRPGIDANLYLKPMDKSLLAWVAEMQPRLFPAAQQYVLQQSHALQTMLVDHVSYDRKQVIGLLLDLQRKVLRLQMHPDRQLAFDAASHLQQQLNTYLCQFYDKKIDAEQFKRLVAAEIKTAQQVLAPYRGWETFLANALLILLSVPLLGIPLWINYYSTGYKRVFFQSDTLNLLENLENKFASLDDSAADPSSIFQPK